MKWHTADPIEYELLKANARANRRNKTTAESAFWNVAKQSGLGEKCRRQYIIACYIADFFFRKSRLIVEIDGDYHLAEEQKRMDAVRQKYFEDREYKVLRFTNEDVLYDLENVISTIKEYIK